MSKELGQYFTKNITLKNTVFNFIKNSPESILEPSCGRGDLVKYVERRLDVKFTLYEIDENIRFIKGIRNRVIFKDFLKAKIDDKFDTIIGNPPYVKRENTNLYIEFIKKCYKLLKLKGELILIVPSLFFKNTGTKKIISKMIENGHFTDIYHPNREDLFKNASIDVVVFRYVKYNPKIPPYKIEYNSDKKMFLQYSKGMIFFSDIVNKNQSTIGDIFKVSVGLVSGNEKILKNPMGNIEILTGRGKLYKYIFIDSFPTNNKALDKYLLKNRETLQNRKCRNFNDENWYEFGVIRNRKIMEENIDRECIYMQIVSRSEHISFKGKMGYFGGNLLSLLPIQDNLDTEKYVEFFNSDIFKKSFTYSNRFKISHSQISNYPIEIWKRGA